MATPHHVNQYLTTHYEGMSPEQLIQLLYKGALEHINHAIEGMKENNLKKRGEHVSKVIAIISELNSSVDPTVKDDSIEFLRGLYNAILLELPKVSLNNDMGILMLTRSYITQLKTIWENDVMKSAQNRKVPAKPAPARPVSARGGYGAKTIASFQAVAV
ncbi:MAG: flagellar export chaperone FliS [Pseudomonadota bacterium]